MHPIRILGWVLLLLILLVALVAADEAPTSLPKCKPANPSFLTRSITPCTSFLASLPYLSITNFELHRNPLLFASYSVSYPINFAFKGSRTTYRQ